ncbi:MAG: glycosyltransferase family 2 protein [Pseudomonadota bacterium]
MSGHAVAMIPAHNESLTVREVVAGTLPHVDEVIVVDDGPTCATSAALAGSGARVIRHEVNLGKGQRLTDGMEMAFGEGAAMVITLDADRQHDPYEIPAFLAAASAPPGALVIGERSASMPAAPTSRAVGSRFGNFFIGWACERRVPDAHCAMRLYPTRLWREVTVPNQRRKGFLFEAAILLYAAEAGIPFVFVPVKARYQDDVLRPSHFDPIRDFCRLFVMAARFLVGRWGRPGVS